MTESKDLDWLFKCRQCEHYRQVQAGVNAIGCRLKYCRYKPSDEAKEFYKLQRELDLKEHEKK